jgi:nucleoside-diphosphate-sugar epimerase
MMADKETVLITGATGFVGGWLAETLHLTNSAHVRAGVRSWATAARLGRFPLDIVRCDVLNRDEIARAVSGATAVVHCAIGSPEVIVEGTRNVLEAAHAQGIRRFVHLSTAEVYGNVSGQIEESAPFQYTGAAYGDAKIEAEKLGWAYHEKGLPLVVIRPPIVYGPFGKDFSVAMARKLKSGNWGIFEGYGEGLCNLIYVSDLVAGVRLALRNESAIGEAFNLSGPETITWNDYFRRFNAALGLPELTVKPPSNSRLRAAIAEPVRASAKFALKQFEEPLKKAYQRSEKARYVMQRFERYMKTTPRLAELGLYNRNALYPSTKAQTRLGYRPRIGIDTGLNLTAAWIHHLGLLDDA